MVLSPFIKGQVWLSLFFVMLVAFSGHCLDPFRGNSCSSSPVCYLQGWAWENVVSMEPVCVTFQGKLKTRCSCELSQFLNVNNQFCFLKAPCKLHTIHLRISPVCRLRVCNLCLRGVSQRPNNGGPGYSGAPGMAAVVPHLWTFWKQEARTAGYLRRVRQAWAVTLEAVEIEGSSVGLA